MSLPPLPPNISSLTAPLLFGNLFSFGLFGVLCAQVYAYAVSFPDDKKSIKCLVYSVFLFEVLQTALVTADSYYWFVSGFGDMRHLANPYISPYDTPLMCAIIALVVQFWFCYRVWIMRRTFLPMVILIMCFSVAQLVGATIGVYFAQHGSDFDEARKNVELIYIWLAGSAIADVLIAIIMTYLLLSSRNANQPHSYHLLMRLARLTVETNALTAGFAVFSLIIYASVTNANWFVAPTAIIGKLYSNTLILTFNNRMFIREDRLKSLSAPHQLACVFATPTSTGSSATVSFAHAADSLGKVAHIEGGQTESISVSY